MKPQCYFETVDFKPETNPAEGVRATLAKRRDEARKQREIETRLQEARQLQTVIISFEREVANLDDSIMSELALSRVREPCHFAYPISARMMKARRDNLKSTIAGLTDRLARVSQPNAELSRDAKIGAIASPWPPVSPSIGNIAD